MDDRESQLLNHWHPRLMGYSVLILRVRVEREVPSFRAGIGFDDGRLRT